MESEGRVGGERGGKSGQRGDEWVGERIVGREGEENE